MPQILTSTSLYIEDYLDNNGFDGGQSSKIGWTHRDKALEILNKHLFGTDIEAVEYDGSSGTNNCRIHFCRDGEDVVEPDEVGEYFRPHYWEEMFNEDHGKTIAQAIEAADLEFDDAVLDDISRVLNTKMEDLPLLVGMIKHDTAKRIYEILLKGASCG